MTLEEWKDEMAERFTGRFAVVASEVQNRVRHDTRTDVDGNPCCPITAYAFEDDDDFVDASNRCADLAGIGLGLDPDDVGTIMDAADDVLTGSDRTRELRRWMDAVLVHGTVYEA
ncbi:MAG: hypothetical protein OXE96_16215 [Gemmatimonadetes bacterium]|nr:hypothetical protein [Gemmatimonadota bacterium]